MAGHTLRPDQIQVILFISGRKRRYFDRPLVGKTVGDAVSAIDPDELNPVCPLPSWVTLALPHFVDGEVADDVARILQYGEVLTVTGV